MRFRLIARGRARSFRRGRLLFTGPASRDRQAAGGTAGASRRRRRPMEPNAEAGVSLDERYGLLKRSPRLVSQVRAVDQLGPIGPRNRPDLDPGVRISRHTLPPKEAAVRRPWERCACDGATPDPVPRGPGAAASAARQSTAKRLRSRSLRSSAPGRAARRRRTLTVSAPRSSGSMPAKTSSRSSMLRWPRGPGKQGSVRNLGDAAGLSGPAGGRCRAGRAAR